jgi:hypothetical protein
MLKQAPPAETRTPAEPERPRDRRRGNRPAGGAAPVSPQPAAAAAAALEHQEATAVPVRDAEASRPAEREIEAEPEEFAADEFEIPPQPDDDQRAAYRRLGAEGLARLRARYAEVLARLAEKPMDEPARDELKLRAERLNPDGWVTDDDVAAGLEQYEAVYDSLRAIVGQRRRRRRRR